MILIDTRVAYFNVAAKAILKNDRLCAGRSIFITARILFLIDSCDLGTEYSVLFDNEAEGLRFRALLEHCRQEKVCNIRYHRSFDLYVSRS